MPSVAHLLDNRPGIKSRPVWFLSTQIHFQLFMLPDKKKSLESYLLLSNKCLEKTLGYESYPMYEVVYGAKRLLIVSKIPVSLDVLWREVWYISVSSKMETPFNTGVNLHFGRDKPPGDHISDFQIYSSFGFHWQSRDSIFDKGEVLYPFCSLYRDCLIVSHNSNLMHL